MKNRICKQCIGDEFIRADIERDGKGVPCSYCSSLEKTLPLSVISFKMSDVLDRYYEEMPRGPESSVDWEQKGDPVEDIIAGDLNADPIIAHDIRNFLYENEHNHDEEWSPFDDDAHYQRRSCSREIITSPFANRFGPVSWERFEAALAFQSRYFSKDRTQFLESLFSSLHDRNAKLRGSVMVSLGRDTKLYRSRIYEEIKELLEDLRNPSVKLGPPPGDKAGLNRFNAEGVSVFYGALDHETAITETAHSVGAFAVVGRFSLLREVRLLDISRLSGISHRTSVFSPDYLRDLELVCVLEYLSDRAIRPSSASNKKFDYLATQVIAEFLANETELNLDGIQYPSAQNPRGVNIVLFHKASLVDHEFVKNMRVTSVTPYHEFEDAGFDFSIEMDSAISIDTAQGQECEKDDNSDIDIRTPTLRLCISDIAAYTIDSVRFGCTRYPIKINNKKTFANDDPSACK